VVISVKALVAGGDTAAQGCIVYDKLCAELQASNTVTVDFTGIMNITSSFANTAFVPLLDHFSFDAIKARLVIQGANRQISNMLRDRMSKENAKNNLAA
jgi:hypothetical protein